MVGGDGMRINKKGGFFALYIVAITLLMMFVALWMSGAQKPKTDSSFISPVNLLELEDNYQIFEVAEKKNIELSAKVSLNEVGEDNLNTVVGRQNFERLFKEKFFDQMFKNGNVVGFLFSGFKYDEKIKDRPEEEKKNIIKDVMYEIDFDGNNLVVKRNKRPQKVSKYWKLQREDMTSRFSFPVRVEFTYDQEYDYSLAEIKALI